MTSPSKRKGDGFEREVQGALEHFGMSVERVGAQGGMSDAYDLIINHDGRSLRGECKRRRDGFREMYGWLEGNDLLFVRSDRKQALVTMRLSTFLELVKKHDSSS